MFQRPLTYLNAKSWFADASESQLQQSTKKIRSNTSIHRETEIAQRPFFDRLVPLEQVSNFNDFDSRFSPRTSLVATRTIIQEFFLNTITFGFNFV